MMRLLDAKKIEYRHFEYEGTADGAAVSGDEVARLLGEDPEHDRSFYTVSDGGVVVIPKGARIGY